MVKRKERMSLKDLKRTDEMENLIDANKEEVQPPIAKPAIVTKTINIAMTKEDTAEERAEGAFEKLSVAVPTEMFETLQDISRQRRRAKKKHTMSQMVREALSLWLEHRNQTNSI